LPCECLDIGREGGSELPHTKDKFTQALYYWKWIDSSRENLRRRELEAEEKGDGKMAARSQKKTGRQRNPSRSPSPENFRVARRGNGTDQKPAQNSDVQEIPGRKISWRDAKSH
jgi:hypothetical protein